MKRICIAANKDKMMGFIHINWIYFVHIMSSFSKHYSVSLNTLDACWIAVAEWSNSSRCRKESVYLFMDKMPTYMIIAVKIT